MALNLLRLLTAALVLLLVFPASGVEAEPAAPQVLGLNLTKTVGLDPNSCATTDSVTVDAGTPVTYCYQVVNTGDEPLVSHDLLDSELGSILTSFSYPLTPSASVFLTQTAILTDTVTNSATWTARNSSGQSTSDSDTATVNMVVPSLVLTKTVGLDPNSCATTDSVTVDAGTPVTYCYQVVNTGPIILSLHTLTDDKLGSILTSFSYPLAPAASVFLTQTQVITETVTNLATWEATTPGGLPASASDTATVNMVVPSLALTKTVGLDPNSCATTTQLTLDAPAPVTYCYQVANTGLITLSLHTLTDDKLGSILTSFSYPLAPAASVFLTQTVTLTDTVTNTAEWSATTPGGLPASASANATVVLVRRQYLPPIWKGSPP